MEKNSSGSDSRVSDLRSCSPPSWYSLVVEGVLAVVRERVVDWGVKDVAIETMARSTRRERIILDINVVIIIILIPPFVSVVVVVASDVSL